MHKIILFTFTLACADAYVRAPQEREKLVEQDNSALTWPLSDAQQRLHDYLHNHPQHRELLSDVRLWLEAEQTLAAGEQRAALQLWQRAFAATHGVMQQHVLGKYLHLLADMLVDKQPLSFYVQEVRTQLSYESETLVDEVAKHLQGRLAVARDDFQPPTEWTLVLPHDPTLEKHAHRYCQPNADRARWHDMLSSFDSVTKIYWRGLTAVCLQQSEEALENFQLYLRLAADNPAFSHPQFVLTAAAGRVAAGRKLVKSRAWQASAFTQLVEVWQRDGFVTHLDLNMTQAEFLQSKSNDYLWAARSLARQADYEQAQALAQEALQLVAAGLQLDKDKEKFIELAAEAYHVLAFRIAVEQQDYQQALSYSDAALHYQVSDAWRERILWHKGLYHYLAQDWQQAASGWQAMLQQFPTSSFQAQLLFWLAKVTENMRSEAEAEHVDALQRQAAGYRARLAAEHPLSYYHVTIAQHGTWYEQQRVERLEELLAAQTDLAIDEYRQHAIFGKTLQRAEIFINLQLLPLAKLELQELENRLAKQPEAEQASSQEQIRVGLKLYISRLYARVDNYLHSIVLTTWLDKKQKTFWQTHPEQLLIYYPRPHLGIYYREACHNDLEAALLLAVSRQESAFNATARGGAQEFGLMQLLPSTARRVAENNSIMLSDHATELLTPAMNIKLGALYLHSVIARYPDNLAAAISAYNAGEEAADAWTQRRAHDDPLVWIELIAFGTTRTYVKRVQRNLQVYRYLLSN